MRVYLNDCVKYYLEKDKDSRRGNINKEIGMKYEWGNRNKETMKYK